MNRLSLIILLYSCSSCSNIHFKTDNSKNRNTEISFEENKNHKEVVNIKVEKEFFLWGYFPAHELNIDKELANKGVESISGFEITLRPSPSDFLLTFLTFGVYYPQTYYLAGKSNIQ